MNNKERAEPVLTEPHDSDLGSEAPQVEPEGIVSVNSYGRSGKGVAGKIAFVVLALAVIAAGGLWTFTKLHRAHAEQAATQSTKGKEENQAAAISHPKQFSREITPEAVPAVASKPMGVVIDPQGHVVPAVDPLASGTPISTVSNAPGASAGGQPKASRYGGSISAVSSNSLGGGSVQAAPAPRNPTSDVTAPLVKALDRLSSSNNAQAITHDNDDEPEPTELGAKLASTNTGKVSATMLGDRNMILPKGKSIDCTLTSRIISELPGFTTCVLQSNVYSDNGKVLLLEKGSEATGEYGNTMVQGQHRIFVVWDRIKTPKGVLINLNSPGTDPLGTSGVPGFVDNRWFERIGSAFMLSFIKDLIGYEIAKNSSSTAGNVAFQNTTETGEKMSEKVLESTINLKPVLYKNQGETISIFVARDLDFGSVYKLSLR